MGQLRKLDRRNWKERLKICKIAKFKSDNVLSERLRRITTLFTSNVENTVEVVSPHSEVDSLQICKVVSLTELVITRL